ncbi:chemotaxis protein MotC [Aminobacter anthyllidis]|uniref:Chemotaxis protein MotC n=1 Tax=Aminobacter anthyllidis TaxID=1035067 RepID=A0A9X1D709_9HYPH|nr:chemotaxis protein MotC [Aminobacter anthyllidis]MBT1158777.1 chemotaxis protein MotC [Aminobacter anthyllidis]
MRLAATLSGAALIALLVAGVPGRATASEAPALEPYQLVRCLQLLQDRIASGDQASLPLQRRLLEMTDERMRTADVAAFKDPKNFRALLIYAMSGGNPLTIEQVVSRLTLEEADQKLAQGVIDYLRGKPKGTVEALASIDPLTQISELGAFLALVKGSVSIAEQPEQAMKLFDQARLLSPGTLVEEAALRRSVALASRVGDGGRFLRNSTQYVRNYLRSPYASQFADAFVAGVVALHSSINLDTLAEITAAMDAEQEQVVYLRIARRAAIDGLTELSAFASAKAEKGRDGTLDSTDPRAQLYSGLSSVTSGTAADMLGKLGGIDRDKLSKGDRALLDAVEAVASELTSAVPAAPASAPKPVDIEDLPPAPLEVAPPAVDPMIPDAAEAPSPAPSAPVRSTAPAAPAAPATPAAEQPAVAAAPRVVPLAQQQPEPAEPEDPKITEARRTLESIDELLGGSPK